MSKEQYSKFDKNVKSSFILDDINFRKATNDDSIGVAKLIYARDGKESKKTLDHFVERTSTELKDILTADDFHMFVALSGDEIVGFGRSILYDLSKVNVPYVSPSGWYLMGVIVDDKFRRRGIGETLTNMRIKEVSNIANEIYYIVNANNKSSIRLHKKIGFEIVEEGAGFLQVTFSGSKGFLCQKNM